MRTPGHDFELAAGLLFAEGVLAPGQIRQIAYCTDATLTAEQEFNVVTVELDSPPLRQPSTRLPSTLAASSACGVCGTQSIEDVCALATATARRRCEQRIPAQVLGGLPDQLRAAQRVFDTTGGLHAAGLFDATGSLIVVREDIGRHNAVDKVIGERLLAQCSTATPVVCVSGRIGFELVQKAAVAGIGVLAGIGAPSSLAARLATESGLTLVGFLRADRFVIYAGGQRIGV